MKIKIVYEFRILDDQSAISEQRKKDYINFIEEDVVPAIRHAIADIGKYSECGYEVEEIK